MAEIKLYQSPDGSVTLDVRTDSETVWLTQQQMATLFGRERSVIARHISNAEREELEGVRTRAKYAQVQAEGERTVEREIEHFNLDLIISVGYRVKSPEGIRFRRWANDVLKRYLIAGVVTNEARLREVGAVAQMLERSNDPAIAGIAEDGDLVSSNALAAMTLMTAMSKPEEKETMIRLVTNMLIGESEYL